MVSSLAQKLTQCALMCEYCADACLDEDDVSDLKECIRKDKECADVCWALSSLCARPPVRVTPRGN